MADSEWTDGFFVDRILSSAFPFIFPHPCLLKHGIESHSFLYLLLPCKILELVCPFELIHSLASLPPALASRLPQT